MTAVPNDEIIYVDHFGCAAVGRWPTMVALRDARVAEADAWRAILTRATPPAECGPAIPVAPARGATVTFVPREVAITDAGNWRVVPSGHEGRHGARVASVFDTMTLAAQKAHARKVKQAEKAHQRAIVEAKRAGKPEPEWRAPVWRTPFTKGQVTVALDYAALTERCQSAGLKCASLETVGGGGTGNGSREEAILADLQRLRMYHARIGDGLAKEVRRFRPGGRKRHAIRVRTLVDMVCIGGRSLEAVLLVHGWQKNGEIVESIRRSLCSALDRMQGYDLARAQNID